MKSYKSKITLPSKAIPAVEFTIRRMSDARRGAFRESIIPQVLAIRVATAETTRLAAEAEPDTIQLEKLSDDVDSASAGIDQAWLRVGLVSIAGIEIDDKPATAETMIEDGPVDLYKEIVDAIKRASSLTGREEGESELPSISGAPADGQTNNSSAATAESTPSTSSETAAELPPVTTS